MTDQVLFDELTTLTCDMIAIPSTADQPAQLQAVIDYAERYAQAIPGVHIQRFEWAGKPSLVVTLRDTKAPALMLNAHLDVVPGRPERRRLAGTSTTPPADRINRIRTVRSRHAFRIWVRTRFPSRRRTRTLSCS